MTRVKQLIEIVGTACYLLKKVSARGCSADPEASDTLSGPEAIHTGVMASRIALREGSLMIPHQVKDTI